MILKGIELKNFCCFDHFKLESLNRLSVVIGENDAGKTVLLNAVEVLIDDSAFDPERHRRKRPDETFAEEVIVEGTFKLEGHDTLPEEFRSGNDKDELYLKKRFTEEGEVFIVGRGYSDERFDTFEDLRRDDQMALLKEYGLKPEGKEENRIEQREELVEKGKLDHEQKLRPVSFSMLSQHMPRIEHVSAAKYRSPDSMIQATLKRVAANVIEPNDPETDQPKERE